MSDEDDRRRARRAAFRHLVLERWRALHREPGTLFWTFGFPLILSVALGLAFRNQPAETVRAVVVAGPGAPEVLERLTRSGKVRAEILESEEARKALRIGKASVVVTPGPEAVASTAVTNVTYRQDPTRPESVLARLIVDDALQRAEGREDRVRTDDVFVRETGSRYIDFLVPGLIGLGLMSSGLWGVGFSLVQMRSRKILKRLVATPMRKGDFFAAFILVSAALSFAQVPLLVSFTRIAFGVTVAGNVGSLLLVAALGTLCFAGMGVLFASRTNNTQIVSGLINVASFPAYLCSGVFFSSERFPDWLEPFIALLPLTALVDALRAIMTEGTPLHALWKPVGVLLAWAIGSFVLTRRLFRWQ